MMHRLMSRQVAAFLLLVIFGLLTVTPLIPIVRASISGIWDWTDVSSRGENHELAISGKWLTALGNTMLISLPTALLTTLLACGPAYVITRSVGAKRFSVLCDLSALVLYSLPAIAFVPFASIVFETTKRWSTHVDTYLGRICFVVMVNVVFCWPFGFIMCRRFCSQLSTSLEEYCVLENARLAEVLRHAVWPRAKQGLASVALLTFVITANDYLFAWWFLNGQQEWKPLTLLIFETYSDDLRDLNRVFLCGAGMCLVLSLVAFFTEPSRRHSGEEP